MEIQKSSKVLFMITALATTVCAFELLCVMYVGFIFALVGGPMIFALASTVILIVLIILFFPLFSVYLFMRQNNRTMVIATSVIGTSLLLGASVCLYQLNKSSEPYNSIGDSKQVAPLPTVKPRILFCDRSGHPHASVARP